MCLWSYQRVVLQIHIIIRQRWMHRRTSKFPKEGGSTYARWMPTQTVVISKRSLNLEKRPLTSRPSTKRNERPLHLGRSVQPAVGIES